MVVPIALDNAVHPVLEDAVIRVLLVVEMDVLVHVVIHVVELVLSDVADVV